MRMLFRILTAIMLAGTALVCHAADQYPQPNMPLYMMDGHMPMMDPYQRPMHPMMQMRHHGGQVVQPPADNQPAAPAPESKTQQASGDLNKQASTSKPHHQMRQQKMQAMMQHQKKMEQSMQRMEKHLANIEQLIRRMAENR